MKTIILLLLFACCAALLAAENPPNVVYILVDDMGYGDVSALNPDGKIPTPNINRIAKEGMAFTDAHTSSACCTPSRYSIMTGRYCWRTELKRGVVRSESDACLIDEGRMTVANVLRDSGYSTALIGKWHLGWEWGAIPGREVTFEKKRSIEKSWIDIDQKIKQGPTEFGFDYFFGICGSLDMHPYVWVENDQPVYEYWQQRGGKNPKTHLPEYTNRAVDYIRNQDGTKPFFLFLSLTSPHTPVVPNKEFEGKSPLGKYGDFCIETDHRVGQILDALDEKGLADNTLVYFAADNGCSTVALKVADAEQTHGHYTSYLYRGYKGSVYEGGHRIPFLVRWPKVIEAGSEYTAPVGVFDVIKTVAEINKVHLPDTVGEDSISLLPAFKQEPIPEGARWALINHSSDGEFALRQGDWKLVFPSKSKKKKKAAGDRKVVGVLYNLAEDPGETSPVTGMPEKADAMHALLNKIVTNGRSTPGHSLENDTGNSWLQYDQIK